ncbi:unnamed protein product [Caenorhabditis angaria]|uniref:Mitochondrial fission process protein 1 n=1 Tax=Caenorhabditis angaria TaxID=860376 RepID=A0A9P1IZ11_9PELO|nr:unnamed protein product [Caenorhabditis angaria]
MERVTNYLLDLDSRISSRLYKSNKYPEVCIWIEWMVHGFPWFVCSSLFLIIAYGREWEESTQFGYLLLNFGLYFDLIIVALLKFLVQRERPVSAKGHILEHTVDFYSFPSGHTTRAVMLIVLLSQHSSITSMLFIPLPFIIGLSRVALGRHYITDVLAGLVIGYIEGLLMLRMTEGEKDIFRDTPVRFLGYANEVGEAFRSLVKPIVVKFSYVVAFGYVAADSIDKSAKESKKSFANDGEKTKRVAIVAGDTVLWQTLASVMIPGFTINRFCHFTNILLEKSTKLPPTSRKYTVTLLGLATIPFIVHPIDHFVETSMNNTVRKLYNDK